MKTNKKINDIKQRIMKIINNCSIMIMVNEIWNNKTNTHQKHSPVLTFGKYIQKHTPIYNPKNYI